MKGYIEEFLQELQRRNDLGGCRDIIFFMWIKGGYECWLQLELANFFRKRQYNVFREVTKISEIEVNIEDRQRVDLVLRQDFFTQRVLTACKYILVEIKCQLSNQECKRVASGFWIDVLKLSKVLAADFSDTEKYAIAFVYLSVYQKIDSIIKIFNEAKNEMVQVGRANTSGYETGRELEANEIGLLASIAISGENICWVQFQSQTEYCCGMAAVVLACRNLPQRNEEDLYEKQIQ